MKISYQRTGGFAGMMISFEIAAASLSAEEVQELEDLVKAADFFTLPEIIPTHPSGADQFHYTLTIETAEQQHTVQVGDAAVPENLWPLINKLRILSRSNPGT